MAIQPILSTDKLQSGFRAKYNLSIDQIITGFTDNGNGTVTATLYGGTTLTMNLTSSFFTKTEVSALLAGISPGRQPVEYAFTQADILEDGVGTGNWYIDYKTDLGAQPPNGVMPYAVLTQSDDPDNPGEFIINPVSPMVYNKTIWTFGRIYGFPDPATDQDIIIFAI